MPNLVGIGNSQVPTNAMLGGLAYQDPTNVVLESVEPKKISKIRTSTSAGRSSSGGGTQCSVFVYNTRHDTDGGEWRKRCSHTTWYNEPLNTDVRGSRREFPSIVVIELFENGSGTERETDDMIIYDADDPNMPMWMKVRFVLGSGTNSQVRAMNGNIVFSATNNGIQIMNFAADTMTTYNHAHKHQYSFIYPSRLGRTATPSTSYIHGTNRTRTGETGKSIVDEYINDFDVTVLPDAEVDPSTGLERIFIAGTTQSTKGWFYIKDDLAGNTTNIGESSGNNGYGRYGSNCCFIFGGRFFFAGKNTYGSGQRNSNIYRVRDLTGGYGMWTTHHNARVDLCDNSVYAARTNQVNFSGNFNGSAINRGAKRSCAIDEYTFATGQSSANVDLLRYYIPNIRYDNGYMQSGQALVCRTGYDNYWGFTTGWMMNACENANLNSTLADVDSNGSIGTVENPKFTNGSTSPWYGDSGASLTWQTGNSVIVTNGGGDNSYAIAQANCLVSGRKYKIIGSITPTFSGSYTFRVRAGGSGVQYSKTSGLTSGQSYTFNTGTITADGANLEIGSAGGTMTQFIIENITVLDQTDMDHSQHSRPWTIVGTIKKNPVAPNAELCAYTGWSTGDYMVYNGVTGPGTADFCVMFWCKTPNVSPGAGYFHAWSHGTSSTGGQNSSSGFTIKAYNNNSTGFQWYPYSGNGSQAQGITNTNCIQPYGSWCLITAGRHNGVWEVWINDELRSQGNSNSTNFSDNYIQIGKCKTNTNEQVLNTSLALMRYSQDWFPDGSMIRKVYKDEISLYGEGAKHTLYGTSDEIRSMAFDPDTKILHVGTSQGRSDFRGLNRINNTTTGITKCLHASGGIIAEV